VGHPTAALAPCHRHVVSELGVVVVLDLGLVVVICSHRRHYYISILGIDPTYFINVYGENPTSQKKKKPVVLPGCHGSLGLVIGCFCWGGRVDHLPRVPDGRAG